MIWLPLIILALLTALLLTAPLIRKGETSPARGFISLFMLGFVAIALGAYSFLGRPDLVKPGALKAYAPPAAPGPTQQDIRAAEQMSPEERQAMIISMVDNLAAKLEDNPQDQAGWVRLLRARNVLNQDEQLQKDISRLKVIFSDDPQSLETILSQANLN